MILLVGGTGFIGKNLSFALHRSGTGACCLSNAPDQAFLQQFAGSLQSVALNSFYRNPSDCLKRCTAIVYLASRSTPVSNNDEPWVDVEDNLVPFLKFVKLVQEHNPDAHIVYLSSGGAVYGQVQLEKIPESTPLHPISAYGLGKKVVESALQYMIDQHGIRATILRPANPIGKWQDNRSQGVVGAIFRSVLSGRPFTIMGDGSSVRDFFDVEDLGTAIFKAIAMPEKSVGQVFNVGSGKGYSVREVLGLAEQIVGRKLKVEQLPARGFDVDRVVLDISRIKASLNWQPEHELGDTLETIWQHLNGSSRTCE